MAAKDFVWCRDVAGLPRHLRGGVVAIGNFDGMHRGHQAVLDRALAEAAAAGVPALVLTFEPHPRSVFRPDIPLPRITPAPVKARLVRLLGFYAIVEQEFTRQFAGKSADDFIGETLMKHLGVSHVVTGFDFHFGRNRQGDPAFLAAAGRRHGFGVTQVEAFRDEGGAVVSSSRIRALLGEGDVAEAAGLLGYRFTIEGEVVHGKKLGRTIGFPTANMVLPEDAVLKHGIYAVRLRRADGTLFDGVASFGRRPTVESDGVPLLETYVFGFGGDLYGEVCDVSFFGFLRGEEKFDGLDALMAQIRRDEEEARALLSGVRPLSELDLRLAF
ncbi:bifunctional riboflavin kinase/FAD synthetase [Kumtagia ephedrae]|uniref:Riboflavin biosynthesis protein n=1 Tax=Kumtagia ephedrae TaxID=2116701 RepID=A0A2P7SF32_9HYPH|nr:bifunctional riboflavin kinase/FAD synthetase [Mesorhizobium ephedrae]PSJ61098.1 bifunctional riboflavin kinase/FAD synthetase [Mesorhizobium ephedrae]